MKRYSDWERRLEAHFTGALRTPFRWGVFDCALGACRGVAAITGVDPGADLAGQYASEEEAAELMALFGRGGIAISLESSVLPAAVLPPIGRQSSASGGDLGTLAAAIAESHGMAEVRPSFAHRGDVVLVDNALPRRGAAPSRALGTVDLSGRYAWCVGEQGFVRVPMRRWLRAWHVG